LCICSAALTTLFSAVDVFCYRKKRSLPFHLCTLPTYITLYSLYFLPLSFPGLLLMIMLMIIVGTFYVCLCYFVIVTVWLCFMFHVPFLLLQQNYNMLACYKRKRETDLTWLNECIFIPSHLPIFSLSFHFFPQCHPMHFTTYYDVHVLMYICVYVCRYVYIPTIHHHHLPKWISIWMSYIWLYGGLLVNSREYGWYIIFSPEKNI